MASLLQTVPDVDGTEIIIESTANGYNDFHSLWRKAEAGESEFMPIFLPWSLDPGYRRKVEPDFVMDGDEKKLAELHSLDVEQIAWRRAKISQLGSAEYFAQEYPHTPSEAFISSTFELFHPGQSRYCGTQGDCRALRPADPWRRSCRRRCRPHGDRMAQGALHYQD